MSQGSSKGIIVVMCALLLVAGATRVSATLTLSDTLTDPAGDVVNLTQGSSPSHTEVDILSVSSAEQGANLNVTLTLAGAYNASASYTVSFMADGTDDYSFSYMMVLGFSATGPTGAPIASADGSVSVDGKKLYWTMPKSEVTASTSWKISSATTFHLDMSDISNVQTYMDTATGSVGPGPGPTPEYEEGPSHLEVLYEFMSITHLKMTVTTWLEGNNSLLIRMGMDTDEDGNVTTAEKDKSISDMAKYMTSKTNMTLDGVKGTETDTFDYVGAVGKTNTKATLKMTMVKDITFPEPASADSHVYRTPQDNSSSSGDGFGNVTDNSTFKATTPTGWRFVKSQWPSSIQSFFNAAGTKVEIPGRDFKTAFSSDMAPNITLEKSSSGGGSDKKGFLPGAGALAALVALAIPVVLMAARPRRRA